MNKTTGNNNIALGAQAGCSQTTGSNNIYLGNVGVAAESGVIRIGNMSATTVNCPNNNTFPAQTSTYIAGISGVNVSGSAVFVTPSGQLGVQASSRRFKTDIEPLDSAGKKILQLRPVSFRYRKADDNEGQPLQYGLIAEEVAEIMPDLVQYDKEDKPFAVNYQFLAPLLLAAMQDEHKEIQQLQALLTTLKAQNETLREELAALRHATTLNRVTQLDQLGASNK